MLKKTYRILLYVSVLFFAYYLYRADYLLIDKVEWNFFYLISSMLVLWAGFYISNLSWKNALRVHNIHVSIKQAVHSHGISIFAKYIPGKVWVILGRAAIIAEKRMGLEVTSVISLKEQLLYVLLGLVIGIVPFIISFGFSWVTIFILLSVIGLATVLFSKKIHDLMIRLLKKLLKKEIDIPLLNMAMALPMAVFVLLLWGAFTLAFYFFTRSIIPDAAFHLALSFPLSISYGILAIIVPGGIGIREGILTAYFTSTGIELEQAVTVSVLSRLWFITGEIFIFVTAVILKPEKKTK